MPSLRKFYKTKPVQVSLTAIIFIGLLCLLQQFRPADFGAIDLAQYWSAAKLFIANQNPYDHELLLTLQEPIFAPFIADLQQELRLPIRMWNPPLIFPIILFLAVLNYQTAVLVWLIVSLLLFAAAYYSSQRALFNETGTSLRHSLMPLLFVLTFYPLALNLYNGQLAAILLFGLALFLYLSSKQERETSSFGAGLALSLTLLKPHLLYLVYLYIGYLSLKQKSYRMLLGFATGAVILALPALFIFPEVFQHYWQSLSHPPIYFQTPTIGSWLQGISSMHAMEIRILPTILIGLLFLYLFFAKDWQQRKLKAVYVLIPLSLVSSPYGWTFDQILILPTALWLILEARVCPDTIPLLERKLIPIILIGANLAMMVGLLFSSALVGMHYSVWYPGLIYLLAVRAFKQ